MESSSLHLDVFLRNLDSFAPLDAEARKLVMRAFVKIPIYDANTSIPLNAKNKRGIAKPEAEQLLPMYINLADTISKLEEGSGAKKGSYVKPIFENLSKNMPKVYLDSLDYDFTLDNSFWFKTVLDNINQKQKHALLNGLKKVMSYSGIARGYEFLIDSYALLKNNKEIDEDYLLIEFIKSPNDAQHIGPLIDMKKYQDQYNEKVAGFY